MGDVTVTQQDALDEAWEMLQNGNVARGVEVITDLAKQDYPSAQFRLAIMYTQGRYVDQNFNAAFNWFKRCAEQGSISGQAMLGECYLLGRGTPRDYNKAMELLLDAGNQGNVIAQCLLGDVYRRQTFDGVYTEEEATEHWDIPEAIVWFSRAAAQGDEYAINMIQAICG